MQTTIRFLYTLLTILCIQTLTMASHEFNPKENAEDLNLQIKTENPEEIQATIEKHAKTYKCRVTAKVVDPQGNTYYFGYDGRADKPIRDFSGSIDIGSCTKIFTATSVLQLMEQGKFSLDSRLVDLLPDREMYKNLVNFEDKDYTEEVKLYQLLNHTSGFPDYFADNDDVEFAIHGDSTLHFTPKQLIALADRLHDPELKPGEKFDYSNVNYILLGLIIEKYSGLPYQAYIQKHILDPLGMKDTYFSSLESRKGRSPGFYKGKPAEMPPTMALSAGDIVSTLDDLTTFMKAWAKGSLYSDPATLEMVKTKYFDSMGMGIEYGLGIIDLQGKSFGHGGQTFGFTAYMATLRNGARFDFGCDDATASSWLPAMNISGFLSSEEK